MTEQLEARVRWLDSAEWDAIVAPSPGATGFHARGWLEAMAAWDRRWKPRALALPLADGAVAALPMLARSGWIRRGLLSRAVSSHPTVYGGPVCASRSLTVEDWRAVLAGLRSAPIGRLECFGNVLEPLPGECAAELMCREAETHLIDLTRLPDDALTSFESSCRRAVRKAEKEGVRVARETSAQALREYFDVYRDCLRRWGKRTDEGYPLSLFEALLGVSGVELWCARDAAGRIAAGGLFLFAARHCVYWQGALLEELAHVRPANALHHALIVEARRRGCAYYDFNPSAGLDGVEEFKRKFGAQPTKFTAWRHRHPWVAMLDRKSARRG